MKVIIGIYRIINPEGKIYIGKSKNILKRWDGYRKIGCKDQRKLHYSFLYEGIKNHIFEIIEECRFEELDFRERYWQDFYDVTGQNGLNCVLNLGGYISENKKGINRNEILDISNGVFYYTITEAAISYKIQPHRLGKMLNGLITNKTNLIKCSDYELGLTPQSIYKVKSKYCIYKPKFYTKKGYEVVDYNTGMIIGNLRDAAKIEGIGESTLRKYLDGTSPNRTNLLFKKDYDSGKKPLNLPKCENLPVKIVNILNRDIYDSYKESAIKMGIAYDTVRKYFANGENGSLPLIKFKDYDPNINYYFDIDNLSPLYKQKVLDKLKIVE